MVKAGVAKRELVRELGASHATAIVVGTIIGSGIFLVPAEMMQAVGSAKMVYLAWIVGGVLSLFGALTYAELGALKPQAGGEYVYVRDAYGPTAGFLYGWAWFMIGKPASIASVTVAIVRVLGTFSSLAFLQQKAFSMGVAITWGQLVAMAVTVLISALNYVGVRRAGNFQVVFTLLKIVMIVVIAGIGFSWAGGSWSNFTTSYPAARGGIAGFVAALVAALWAYDGWNDLSMVAGEVSHPERNIPLGLIGGVGIVAALYMLMNAAVQYVMPASTMAASQQVASQATAMAIGVAGAAIVSVGMALSMVVTLNGTVMSGARIPFAMARDGYFFQSLADVHPRFHTPSVAIIVQAVLAIILLAFAGTFRELFSLAIFSEWLFYMLAASTVFVFRRREPHAKRAYKTWGYPAVPALFIAASAILLYYTFVENLRNSLIGTLVILAGIPVFWWFRSKRVASA
ncbi:MAG TPA: amino acid permease [Clostridia bacterium]|nr:amino acid permease [Clostridia bacterium]